MLSTVPPWLTNITQKIFDESRMFPSAINHVLINEYQPNQGIMVFSNIAHFETRHVLLHLGHTMHCIFLKKIFLMEAKRAVRIGYR